ncbi:MAG TPA: phage portal protein [Dehalococcoidia bacterium]|nr:phage portal protein [Dehalococcoidia bacterium]
MSLEQVIGALNRWSPRNDDIVIQPPAITWENWDDFFGMHGTVAGVRVTAANAMNVAAVYACVRILAGVIGSLPLPVFERAGDERRAVKHPLWWLLNEQANERMTTVSFWEYVLACMFLYGDGFAVIRRNSNNIVQAFVPVDARAVGIKTIRTSRWRYETVYFVADGAESYGVPFEDMLHFSSLGFNGERSLSVIQSAAMNAIGIAMAADQHSANTLAAGLTSRVVLESPTGVRHDDEQLEQMRRMFIERYGASPTGGPNSALPIILSNGMTAKPLTINPVDAQLLESRKFQVVDIARAFGVPPFMIGETEKSTSWGSGLEQQVLGFVKFTLNPHLRRIEQELNRKIWPVRERYFTEFNVNGLLRGDAKSRSDFYRAALGGAQGDGWMSIDEVRKLENLPPNENADALYRAPRKADEPNPVPATDPAEPADPGAPDPASEE